jgi:hypothetical protein
LKEVTSRLKALNKGVDVNQLYEKMMKVEVYDEFMLTSIFDHWLEDEKVAKRFMAKECKAYKVLVEQLFQKP